METSKLELNAIAEVCQTSEFGIEQELNELQLALIGGGSGDPMFC